MVDRLGGDFIYSLLNAESSITAIVGTSIYEDTLVPQEDATLRTINYYQITPYDAAETGYIDLTWSIDCRHESYNGSRTLAELVKNTLNREFATVNTKLHYSTIIILQTLSPVDNTDVYNTPVQVRIKRRA